MKVGKLEDHLRQVGPHNVAEPDEQLVALAADLARNLAELV